MIVQDTITQICIFSFCLEGGHTEYVQINSSNVTVNGRQFALAGLECQHALTHAQSHCNSLKLHCHANFRFDNMVDTQLSLKDSTCLINCIPHPEKVEVIILCFCSTLLTLLQKDKTAALISGKCYVRGECRALWAKPLPIAPVEFRQSFGKHMIRRLQNICVVADIRRPICHTAYAQ